QTGLSFESAPRDRPARDVVSDYYRHYEQYFDLVVQRPVEVQHVSRIDDGRLLVTGTGLKTPLVASVVIAAVGTWGAPRIPRVPGASAFRGEQLTTPEYRSAD